MTDAPSSTTASLTRSAAGMGAAAAVSRAFGALRMVVIAAVLGTTYLGNTFQSSNSVSNVLFELLAAGALSAVLVPTFVDLFARGESRRAEEVAGGVLSIALVGLAAVSLLGILLAPQIAQVLTSGVHDPVLQADQRALATFLLRFFVPQVLLYAVGAVTTAVLHARGRFALTAIAPIGNTVVIVAAMVAFRELAGSSPSLDLDTGARLCLALGGTLGVLAFVGVPAIGLRASGFRLRFRLAAAIRDPDVRQLLRLSGWTVVQHAGTGILLAAALVAAGGLAGGVVAYQLAMVVFLAPYGILAQPIHTAVLPKMAAYAAVDDRDGFRASLRWAADSMAVATLPVAAGLIALSQPVMRVLAFGEAARGDGPDLLGASLLGLALGVPVYGGFLLLTRAAYALGDSRTPALAALGSAIIGAAIMVVGGMVVDGPGLLTVIGAGHSLAFLLGGAWLAVRLRSRVGSVLSLAQVRPAVLSAAVGAAAWATMAAWAPEGYGPTLLALAVVGLGGGAIYVGALRAVGAVPSGGPDAGRLVASR